MDRAPDTDATHDDGSTWLVIVNARGQHSLWPVLRPVPEGWHEVGPEGDAPTCLDWIDRHWRDMRPLAG